MKRRKFKKVVLNHCYQRSSDHGVLFYNIRDHLVFFTVFSTIAVRYDVRVVKLVQMPDHIHHSTIASNMADLSGFIRDYTSIFAKEYNKSFHRKGPLFEERYGNALKLSDKAVRTNLLYLDNNPVERKLVTRPEDYQFGYLAYRASDHPFSEKIRLRYASMPLRRALRQVKSLHNGGQHLTYQVLTKMFDTLSDPMEKDQLTDYIINTYSVIDHSLSSRYFGGYENELLAAASNTGSEYDISESFIGKDDRFYAQFSSMLKTHGMVQDIHEILSMEEQQKFDCFMTLRRFTSAPNRQIAAYLHLPVETKY